MLDLGLYCDVVKRFRTGSREICNPPVLDTDEDWCVKILEEQGITLEDQTNGFKSFLTATGWTQHGDYPDEDTECWKKDDLNIILHHTELSYNLWWVATQVAKSLNLVHKDDRIMVFDAIIAGQYGNFSAQPIETEILF